LDTAGLVKWKYCPTNWQSTFTWNKTSQVCLQEKSKAGIFDGTDSKLINDHSLHTVFPLRKFYTEQMILLLRTKRMQLRNHADTQTVKRSQR